MRDDEVRLCQQLYHILTMLTRDEAKSKLQRMKEPSGAEAWRQF